MSAGRTAKRPSGRLVVKETQDAPIDRQAKNDCPNSNLMLPLECMLPDGRHYLQDAHCLSVRPSVCPSALPWRPLLLVDCVHSAR